MTDEDAARACELLADCRLERVRTGHGFHVEDAHAFATPVADLAARTAGP